MAVYEPKNLKDGAGWEKAKAANTDSYGGAAIKAAAHAMCLLDEGKTPKEALDVGFKGKDLTGFLAGCAASLVGQCHERGDEFREHWNQQYGVTDSKGTVNPAIMTIKTG